MPFKLMNWKSLLLCLFLIKPCANSQLKFKRLKIELLKQLKLQRIYA